MPIGRMLTEAAYDLAAVKALTTAYEDVLATLGLKRRTDPLAQMIAERSSSTRSASSVITFDCVRAS